MNNLEFVDQELTATIDHQTKKIKIYKIIKKPTQFYLNKNVDTILGKPLNINLFLGYIDEDNKVMPIPQGFISFTITSLSGQTEYLNIIEHFYNGEIKTQLSNLLPMGSYLLNIKYAGNQYYDYAEMTLQFLISQRLMKYKLDKEYYEQYPNQNFNVNMQLLDAENNKPISHCIINYSFNDYEYITQTNNYGYAQLTATMPNTIQEQCITKYPLQIKVENESYHLTSPAYIDIHFKKYKTNVVYTTSIDDNNKINIVGDVYGYDDNDEIVNVDYGIVNFNILNFNENTSSEIDTNGHFTFNIPITQTENANLPTETFSISTPKTTNINIDMPDGTTLKRNYVEKHHMKFTAIVTSQNEIVPYGMVTFIIMQNYNEIYRYITELDKNGEAFFYFDVSTIGEYQIKAQYHKIFEFQASESNIKTYTIED